MKKIMIAGFLIFILIFIVGCEKTGQTVKVAQEEQKGKLITVKEQSVEINKPTSPPTTVPSDEDRNDNDEETNNKDLINQLSQEKGLDTSDSSSSSSSSDGEQILILNFKGTPETLEVTAGTTVTWRNEDIYGHKIGIFKLTEGPVLHKGDTWSYTFAEPGEYLWMSMGHSKTNGNVIVS